MPTYDYACKECGHQWESMSRIADREEPTKAPCPECKAEGTVFICIGASNLMDPVRLNHKGKHKPTPEFSEQMKRIKTAYPNLRKGTVWQQE